jgi:phage terminase large subunit
MDLKIPDAFGFLFEGEARYRAAYGGRGSAKSHTFATASLVRAYQRPIRVLCCREVQNSIKDSVKRLLDDKIAELGLQGFFDQKEKEILGQNGSLFIFAGLRTNPDTVKSTEGIDLAWVEEANTVSNRSLELLIPTVRRPGSEIWFTWNPRFPTDPVDAMFRGGNPPPKAIVREVSLDDNPWFPDVLREDMEWDRARNPEKYAHVWRGAYLSKSEARVFHNWRIGTCEPPAGCRPYFGADWGFANDPSVLIRCWAWGRTLYVDREIYRVGCEIDLLPELFLGMNDTSTPDVTRWPIFADCARPETISYMARHGYPCIEAARKGPASVEDGVEFLKSYDIIISPECRHTIDEFTMYAYKTDKLTDEILPLLDDRANHCIDACRYALEKIRRPGAIAFTGTFRSV